MNIGKAGRRFRQLYIALHGYFFRYFLGLARPMAGVTLSRQEALRLCVIGVLLRWGHDPLETLEAAVSTLTILIGTDCECDNTHQANGTKCCLCWYQAVLAHPDDGKE